MDGTLPYFARVLADIQYTPGTWHGVRVGVFRRENGTDVQVGEYERNYPSLLDTFAPFHLDGRDLALYSPDYTCTRLLELPSCRDIGGEDTEDYAHEVRITRTQRFDLRTGHVVDPLA